MLMSACRTALQSSNVFNPCTNTESNEDAGGDKQFSTLLTNSSTAQQSNQKYCGHMQPSNPIDIPQNCSLWPNNSSSFTDIGASSCSSSQPTPNSQSCGFSNNLKQQPEQRTPLMALGQVVDAIDEGDNNLPLVAAAAPSTTAKIAEERENNTICQSCSCPIKEAFLLKISNHLFHETCAVCSICGVSLNNNNFTSTDKCYERKGKLFCKMHYFNDFSPYQCSGCLLGITPNDLVYKLKQGIVYHVACHRCYQCHRPLVPGEQILVDEHTKTVSCMAHSSDSSQVISSLFINNIDSSTACLPPQAKGAFPHFFPSSFLLPPIQQQSSVSSQFHTNQDFLSDSLLSFASASNSTTMNPNTSLEAGTMALFGNLAASSSSPNFGLTGLGFNEPDFGAALMPSSSLKLSAETQHTQNILAAAAAAGFGDLCSSFTSSSSTTSLLDCSSLNNFANSDLLPQPSLNVSLASTFRSLPAQYQQQQTMGFGALSPMDPCLSFENSVDNNNKPTIAPQIAAKAKRKVEESSADTSPVSDCVAGVPQYPFEMYTFGEMVTDADSKYAKRRGPRTTIKQDQLDVLNQIFGATPKPSKHARAKLALDTGLSMRVIQVWFQNRRSKERRLKHLCNFLRHYEQNGIAPPPPPTDSQLQEINLSSGNGEESPSASSTPNYSPMDSSQNSFTFNMDVEVADLELIKEIPSTSISQI